MAKRKRGRPDEDDAGESEELSGDAKEALDLAKQIEDSIEDAPESAQDLAAGFFESVLEKAKAIAGTVERTGRATDGQRTALQNMLDGVRKWHRED